jgi:hypothetical protein
VCKNTTQSDRVQSTTRSPYKFKKGQMCITPTSCAVDELCHNGICQGCLKTGTKMCEVHNECCSWRCNVIINGGIRYSVCS